MVAGVRAVRESTSAKVHNTIFYNANTNFDVFVLLASASPLARQSVKHYDHAETATTSGLNHEYN